jgi:hypothetical protein
MDKATRFRRGGAIAAALLLVLGLTACTSNQDSTQQAAQKVTTSYQQAATAAVPYPLAKMTAGGWSERKELTEHLLRQNDPKSLRYVVMLSQQGQPIAQWPIQGMVFDPNSQLTNSQTVSGCPGDNSACGIATTSPGDNGTWGPEAGSAAFFTTAGVEIQLPPAAIWIEADAPLNITTTPVVTYNVTDKPSVNHGGVKVGP